MEISPIPFFHHVRNRTFVQDTGACSDPVPPALASFAGRGKRTTKGPANARRASRSAGPSVLLVMTLLNCPALGCRARRLDDGESDNADKPGAPAKNQFRVASRTQGRDEVRRLRQTRGLTRDRLAGCPPVQTSADWKAFRPWTPWVACTTSATFSRATSRP